MHVLKWGLIGCGDIADKRVAPALRGAPGSRLVAVARARAELAADFAARHGAARSHGDWRALVQRSRDRRRLRGHAGAAARRADDRGGRGRQARAVRETDGHGRRRMRAHDRGGSASGRPRRRLLPAPLSGRRARRALLAAGEVGTPVFARLTRSNGSTRRRTTTAPGSCGGRRRAAGRCSTSAAIGSRCCTRSSARSVAVGLPANVLFARDVEDTAVARRRLRGRGPAR